MGTKRSLTKAMLSRARAKFLETLATTGQITKAAKAAGVARETPYAWRKLDEQFAKDWDAALEKAYDVLEDVAIERATKGHLKPVYQGGVKVGSVREYSDGLLALLLKAHKPAFRDKSDVNLTGSVSLVDLVQNARKPTEGQS